MSGFECLRVCVGVTEKREGGKMHFQEWSMSLLPAIWTMSLAMLNQSYFSLILGSILRWNERYIHETGECKTDDEGGTKICAGSWHFLIYYSSLGNSTSWLDEIVMEGIWLAFVRSLSLALSGCIWELETRGMKKIIKKKKYCVLEEKRESRIFPLVYFPWKNQLKLEKLSSSFGQFQNSFPTVFKLEKISSATESP